MRSIAFVWDNFGPMHVDRCEAVQALLGPEIKVWGIEQYGTSDTYDWMSETGASFEKITLAGAEGRREGPIARLRRMLYALRQTGARDVFFCNYERPEIFLSAVASRLRGRRCYVMGCSKFDDTQRRPSRELIKSLFFLPYSGAISSGERSKDYMRFLGVPKDRVEVEYNTLSVQRIREAAGVDPAPAGTPFAERHFTAVARFVPKKNLSMLLDAYAQYARGTPAPRPLHLCGSGPLETALREQTHRLGIAGQVVFRGFLQTDDIARTLGRTLCLLLPSVEEQFGNVVVEAQAVGVPCIVSVRAGARDRLIRSGVNGFLIEPDNAAGMAWMMARLAEDHELWTSFATASFAMAETNDVRRFAEAAERLLSAR